MRLITTILGLTLLATSGFAQDEAKVEIKQQPKSAAKKKEKKPVPKNKQAFLTPKEAGPDFAIQGEYEGKIHDGALKLGLQVIARGDGRFEAVAYPGGLPGAGWTGDQKLKMKGETDGKVTTLTSDRGKAVITEGMAIGYNAEGDKIGELKKVVRKSPTLGMKPPKDAIVLFDGKSADAFKNGKLINGMLQQGMTSKAKFDSFKLHMEFMLSFMPYASGQGRSNSGVYMQGRYECQILDSFGLNGEHNECGGIYELAKPKVNMCLPPLSWQTYDAEFIAAKFDEGKKTANARLTVKHLSLIHISEPTRPY